MTTIDTHDSGETYINFVGKKKNMLVTSIYSFSHNVFYPLKDKCNNLIDI